MLIFPVPVASRGWPSGNGENIERIRLRELLVLKTCRTRSGPSVAATIRDGRVRTAARVATRIAPSNGRCVILGIGSANATGCSPRVLPAVLLGMQAVFWTCTPGTWLHAGASIPTASSPGEYEWWWRTACRTGPPVGIGTPGGSRLAAGKGKAYSDMRIADVRRAGIRLPLDGDFQGPPVCFMACQARPSLCLATTCAAGWHGRLPG